MNWLAEYFAQRASPIMLSLWAQPPFAIGPDGPLPQRTYASPYPGIELVFTPGVVVERAGRPHSLPAHYDTVAALETPVIGGRDVDVREESFFKRISIYAPSTFNPEFLVKINDDFSFVPTFAVDGSPAFFGVAMASSSSARDPSIVGLPWFFQGYLSI
ncbi:hypothetical protein B0G57_103108 [Trinickia symbiotica]|uniref:Uncharacterized protein n=1 Tax=Trinickia symbiotica TaxID=863227 RepID=A0A2N7X4H3_9BURK|nr:hypothetical protein [Trinickia symbiotica]PMS36656.1 hypothetical protein C0Z20_11150 [Trinickia symbiotica]PPK46084.1 hypothetical protein B0G57_103108 [Trinickia symbiotica]